MKFTILYLLIVLLLFIPNASTGTETAGHAARGSITGANRENSMLQPGIDTAAIDRFLTRQMASQRIPGMALAITRGSQVLYLKGYGTAASGAPVTPQTPFLIASLSKSFTALAVLQQVEAGKIDLDAPVQAYLPGFTLADREHAARITVRQLLNHTSGLADTGYPEMRLPQAGTLEERVTNMRSARQVGLPGSAYYYFDPNYGVLARLVEVTSGQPFSEYLRANVFGPLGMRNTHNVNTPQEASQKGYSTARGHLAAYGTAYPVDELTGFLSGSAGVVSTAEDMAHYLILQNNAGQFRGAALATPESVRLMHTPPEGIDSPYGMGWWEGEASGQRIIEHNGILSVYYSEAVLVPEGGYGIALLYDTISLPHSAFAFPTIKNGLVALLSGKAPPAGGFTVTHWALIIAALSLGGIGLAVRSLFRLPAWFQRARGLPAWKLLPGILWAFFPAVFLLGLPELIARTSGRAFSYAAVFRQMVDVIIWLGTVAFLGAINGAARVLYLIRRKSRSG